MFTWAIRIAVFAFMFWTMSIPGTECYISPQCWSVIVLIYWFVTRKQENNHASRIRIWPC